MSTIFVWCMWCENIWSVRVKCYSILTWAIFTQVLAWARILRRLEYSKQTECPKKNLNSKDTVHTKVKVINLAQAPSWPPYDVRLRRSRPSIETEALVVAKTFLYKFIARGKILTHRGEEGYGRNTKTWTPSPPSGGWSFWYFFSIFSGIVLTISEAWK